MREAALANAQLALAKRVLKAEFRREGAPIEEDEAKAEEALHRMGMQVDFGRMPPQVEARQRRGKTEVKVVYFRSLFGSNEGERGLVPPADEPVQLTMFAV